jgi:hypothetical protein
MGIHRSIKIAFCSLVLAFCSAQAGLVIWDLNPNNANGPVGGSSHVFTSSGFSITAYAFDNAQGRDTPHDLWFKNDDVDHGLGVTGTAHNELQVGPNGPLQYIQFDLHAILTAGFFDGQLKVSSIDPGEAFDIYGSNHLGELGAKISLAGGPYGDSNNNLFVNIPNFGSYRYVSVVAAIDDVLPWAFAANMPAIPELGGAGLALVLLGFFGVVLATRQLRARRS